MNFKYLAVLLILQGSMAPAQDLLLFDPSSFGQVVLSQRQSAAADFEFEAQIGTYNNEFVSNYGDRSIFARTGRAVGRLDILTDKGHAPCTAFLVEENRLLTNHHCVPGIIENKRLGASAIIAVQFRLGYLKDGIEDGTEMFHVNPVPIETSKELDYSVLQIVGGDANETFGALQLSAVVPADRDPLWVIGHPMGEAQRISREKCQADSPAVAGNTLRHTCDTLPGNSGSPIIDAGLQQVVALHNAGSRAGSVNFGIPMAKILANSAVLTAAVSIEQAGDALEANRVRLEQENADLQAERERLALEAEAKSNRLEALAAFSAALEVPARPDRMKALETVIAAFPETEPAERAQQALKRNRAALVLEQQERQRLQEVQATDQAASRARQALQALTDALLMVDTQARNTALKQVVVDFPGSDAAQRAQQASLRIEAALQDALRADGTQTDQLALEALTEALLKDDLAAQRSALMDIQTAFPDTDVALKAALALEQLNDSQKATDASDHEVLVSQARERCILQTASPFDPDRAAGIPAINFEEIDTEAALGFCRAPKAEPRSDAATSFALGRALEAAGEYADAHAYYRIAHELGYVAATTALGRFARDGITTDQDFEKAFARLEEAAAQGDPAAMTMLAALYVSEAGPVRRDFAQARKHLEQAIALSHPHALFLAAQSYTKGDLYPRDPAKAMAFYERAATAGDMRAQYEIAMAHWRGTEGMATQDMSLALDLLIVAAEMGSRRAQTRVGNTYLNGLKVENGPDIAPDFVQAKRWLSLAAQTGYIKAQMQLGKIFSIGAYGAQLDQAEALRWYELAAKQGFVQGLTKTAEMYEAGVGTERDPQKASAYWVRSMELGGNIARFRTQSDWPRDTGREVQRLLQASGVYRGALDGQIGPGSRNAMKILIARSSKRLSYKGPDTDITGGNYGWVCQC